MTLVIADSDASGVAASMQAVYPLFVIPAPVAAAATDSIEEHDLSEAAEDAPQPSFDLSARMILAIILTSVILTVLAVTTVASFAPQGFSAGT